MQEEAIKMAAKEKRKAPATKVKEKEVDMTELSLQEEFVAETLKAIEELDAGLGRTFSNKKEFLEYLEQL
jgi:hypothetical protein